MIIVTCKPETDREKKFFSCRRNGYVKSIEYIKNIYRGTLLKIEGIRYITFFNSKFQYHNPIGPAEILFFYKSGKKSREEYYKNGNHHREDGPAVICYNEDGTIKKEQYWLNGHQISNYDFNKRNKK